MDHDLKRKSDAWKLFQASQNISNKTTHLPQNQNNITEQEVETCNIDVHNKQGVLDLFEDKVEVNVTDVALVLSMSSITGLTDLIEDEIIPKPIPLQVHKILS